MPESKLEELMFHAWQSHVRFILQGKFTRERLLQINKELSQNYSEVTEQTKQDCRYWAEQVKNLE